MIKRKHFLVFITTIFILPLIFMLSACGSDKKNDGGYPFGPSSENQSSQVDPQKDSYNITVLQSTGGRINVSKSKAFEGEEVELSYQENNKYSFARFIVKDSKNNDIQVSNNRFVMPASNVTVTGEFSQISDEVYLIQIEQPNNAFIDYEVKEAKGDAINAGLRVTLYCMVHYEDVYRLNHFIVTGENGQNITLNDNSFIMPEQNVIVSAQIDEILYNITIDQDIKNKCEITVNGNKETAHCGDYIYVTCTPKEGYTFNRWNIRDNSGTISSSNNTSVSFYVRKSDVTISVVLNTNYYSVDVISNSNANDFYILNSNGTKITSGSCSFGEEVTIVCVPKKNYQVSKFTVLPWEYKSYSYKYYDEVEYDENYKFKMPAHNVKISVNLDLILDNEYSITYSLEDGVTNPNTITSFKSGDDNIYLEAPSKTGYYFYHWVDQKDTIYDYGEIVPSNIEYDLVLHATWDPIFYSILFDANGGTGEMDYINQVVYDEEIELPKCTFEKDYYVFAGWMLSEAGEVLYTDMQKVKNLASDYITVTLYAKWDFKTYHITYVDGSESSTVDYTYNDQITIRSPEKEGYTFNYYEVAQNIGNWGDENTHYYAGQIINKRHGDVTLNANYTVNKYTVTFVLNNGSDNIVIKDDFGTQIEVPSDPEKAGYEFTGWDIEVPKTIPSSNITINATYKPLTFNITYYDKNGDAFSGTHENNYPTDFVYDTETILDNPTKTGYLFGGYYKDSECLGSVITLLKTDTNDVVLYAKWTPITYTIMFKSIRLSNTYYQEFTYNVPANLRENEFTHDLYDFIGWTTQLNQGDNPDAVEYQDKEEVINLTSVQGEEIVFNAVWKEKKFTITLVDGDDNILDEIVYSKPVYPNIITIPSDVKEGYTLDCWQIIEGEYHGIDYDWGNGGKAIYYDYYANTENDIVPAGSLYSAWGTAKMVGYFTINQYTITVKDGDDVLYSKIQDYNSAIDIETIENKTTKVGYDFVSYDKEIPNQMPAENITISITWEAQVYDISYKLVGNLELTDVTFENYPTTHTYDQTTKLVFPTKEGFDAIGWYLNSAGKGDEYLELTKNTIVGTNGIITLYANLIQSIYITDNAGSITGLTDYGKTLSHLIIPEYINGVKITYIAGNSFENDMNLKILTVKSDLNFQSSALSGCNNLVEVINLSSSVSDSVFRNYANPWYISHDENYVSRVEEYPNGISYYIDDNDMVAVYYTGDSTSLTIDDNCNKIRAYAFSQANMQEIIIPESVIEIHNLAFYDCDELLTFTFHDKISSLGNSILSHCDKLTTIYYNIPNLLRTYNKGNNNIVYECPLLTNVIIGNNVKVISHDLFGYGYNSSFKSITIPSSVEIIESGAFYGSRIETIIFEVGSNLTTIESNAFSYAFKLYTIYLTNDYLYNGANSQSALGAILGYAENVYVLKSVYEDENNSNTYLTDETIFTQPTTTVTVDENEYYLFTKIQ